MVVHMVAGSHVLGSSSIAFSGASAGSWIISRAAEMNMFSDAGCHMLNSSAQAELQLSIAV